MKKDILILDRSDIPREYYNITADLKVPLSPPLNPATRQPIGPDDLSSLFPMELIKQEVTQERFIPIPQEVRELYARFRPTPIYRARQLEKMIGTCVSIYFKYEGVSPAGSHKTNTAIPQAYYNAKEGVETLVTETGAGQWGTALAYSTALFDMNLEVYMVRVSYDTKPYRKTMMRLFNDKAVIHASPSSSTKFGQKLLNDEPNHPGSLGVAIGEAIERTIEIGAKYSLGSVLNHVLLHQTIIGQEAKIQMQNEDLYPDIIIGCVGGGSNFAGLSYPFLMDKIAGKHNPTVIAVESDAAPKMTQGHIMYDFGDSGKMTPLLKMHTIGADFIPPPIHAGGLRYHGLAPSLSKLLELNLVQATALTQTDVFRYAQMFIQAEGIIPAPESSHAIAQAIIEARKYRNGEKKTILFNLSGHGYLDLQGYEQFLNGELQSSTSDIHKIRESLSQIHV